ncbi:MAG TPA: alpha-glucan family phosphorylase [Actinomycetota bacterium]|jgi:starch phosphorylase|nr:alpha-glucan family phosphorylase [Actinomycetota bacterium]
MKVDGSADLQRAVVELAARLPEPLEALGNLAYNYWWSWTPGGPELWASIDERGWELAGHNPIRLLHDASLRTLQRAADDEGFLKSMRELGEGLRAELDAPVADIPSAAFFCMEYGVHRSLPIFSGGLGVLAGDLVKEASDRRAPLTGVGLLYRQGYFHQRLDTSGRQHEYWMKVFPERLPAVLVTGDDGQPLCVETTIRGRTVRTQIWRVDVGRTRLYLLDTEHPDNHPVDRWITSRLYVTDGTLRLAQYALLGIAGVRALRAMSIEPEVVHLNEGHAVFAATELGDTRVVFTTHTPVAAGNESFDIADVREVADVQATDGDRFGLTEYGLYNSSFRNAVSRLHGQVATDMWRHIDLPISYVTNGVHIGTWMAPAMRDLLDRYLGPDWYRRADQPETWQPIDDIPDAELWDVRNRMRKELVGFATERAVNDRLGRGEPLDYVEDAEHAFDPNVLTLGFARRAAAYKRLFLLTHDPQRALALLEHVQLFLAGKAHPADEEAKDIVRRLFEVKQQAPRVAYLENYGLHIASQLVAGCDVWLNLPRPPLEASGTSGMKAALNGGLNLSVLDGWWAEGFDGSNGWGIDSDGYDDADAKALYDIVEREVVPLFYDRDEEGIPRGWIAMVKTSLKTIGPRFNSKRMFSEYASSAYRKN